MTDITEEQLLLDENEKALMEALELQDENLKKAYVAYAKGGAKEGDPIATKEDIINALKTVEDPEISINIYDLGLVYDISQEDNGDIQIDMTVTSPMCPVAGILPQWAADALALVKGAAYIKVRIVWEPAWSPEKMTEDGKMMIDLY